MKKKHFSKKGFTLIEVLAVVVILAILIACTSFFVSSSVNNGRVSSTTSSLQLFAADTEEILAEYGVLQIEDAKLATSQVVEYLNLIEQFYVHTYFDKESLVVKDTYFEILTSTLLDGWDSPFKLRYSFDSENAGTCMLISPGPDLIFESVYTTDSFGDDIILIVYPKSI